MFLRRLSAVCALIFGCTLTFVVVVFAMRYPFEIRSLERAAVALAAMLAGIATLRAARIGYLMAAMGLALAWQWPSLLFELPAMLAGVWHYSWLECGIFLFLFFRWSHCSHRSLPTAGLNQQ